MWILGSSKSDALFFLLPGLFSIGMGMMFSQLGETSLIYGLLATALIDSGHVYTTFWRTLLRPGPPKADLKFWYMPLFFFLLFSSWYFLKLPGLWTFVVYSTLYHHTRQVYGFSKWYQTLNRRTDEISDKFLYGLAVLPMVIYHFRPGAIGSYYAENDLFLFPNATVTDVLLVLYGALVLGWIFYETKLWRSGTKELNRLISVGYPSLIYGYCFLIGETVTQVLFPLLFIHGIAYFAVMAQTLHRTQRKSFSTQYLALQCVLITAIVFGLSESWLEEEAVALHTGKALWINSMLIGLTLTPLYCHYFYDAIIWKKSHPEAKLIYAQESLPPA
jgi:hypothetical protein